MTYEEMRAFIQDIESCDENIDVLQKGMHYFCSNYDICEGLKHALLLCLDDQYQNHESEQDPEDLKKLKDILDPLAEFFKKSNQ